MEENKGNEIQQAKEPDLSGGCFRKIDNDPHLEHIFTVPAEWRELLNIPPRANALTRWTRQKDLRDGFYVVGYYGEGSLYRVICKPKRVYLLEPASDNYRSASWYAKKNSLPIEGLDFHKIIGWIAI